MNTRSDLEQALPFRIKICGVTQIEDVAAIIQSGADAIGLNFYPASSRYVTLDVAKRLRERAGEELKVVGVWVNEPAKHIAQIADELALDAIQLHGDEPHETLEQLSGRSIVRVVRHPFSSETARMLDWAAQRGCSPAAVLIDAAVPGQYGGTGERLDWAAIAGDRVLLGGIHMLLAGGLNPDNVRSAVAVTCADGVDVASGVESSPGKKHRTLVERFVREAQLALDERRLAD